MPLYEFECPSCKAIEDKICKYSEIPNQVCSACGAKLDKRVTATDNVKFTGVKGSSTM